MKDRNMGKSVVEITSLDVTIIWYLPGNVNSSNNDNTQKVPSG